MAMMENYRQFHLPFFQPETYNLESVHGKVAGELPVIYFLASKFENSALALRALHTSLFLSGIMATYFIAFHFLQRRLLSIFCSLFLYTSPLLVFYGNNFLSDVPSLSVTFIGWAIFLHAYKKRSRLLSLAFICFTLAALLKASQVMNIILCLSYCLLSNSEGESGSGRKNLLIYILAFASILLTFAWYFYARRYNLQNHNTYYYLTVSPVWTMSMHELGLGIWRMTVALSKNYFWRPTSIILVASGFLLFKNREKIDVGLRKLIASSFAFTVLYIFAFYQKMIGHEYYYVVFFVFVLFGLIGALKVYNAFHAENIFSHTALFLFLMANIIYCKHFVAEKLTDNLQNGYLSSEAMQDFLLKNGVLENKSIVSIPDDSPNKTLSQLKRKGFTEFNDYKTVLKNKEADYLLLGNKSLLEKDELKSYLDNQIGEFNGIYLYKLK